LTSHMLAKLPRYCHHNIDTAKTLIHNLPVLQMTITFVESGPCMLCSSNMVKK
jgi:hypothetical protein